MRLRLARVGSTRIEVGNAVSALVGAGGSGVHRRGSEQAESVLRAGGRRRSARNDVALGGTCAGRCEDDHFHHRVALRRPRLGLAQVLAGRDEAPAPLLDALQECGRGRALRRRQLRTPRRENSRVARHVVRLDAAVLVPRSHLRAAVDGRDGHMSALSRWALLRLGRHRKLRGDLHARVELRARSRAHLPGDRARPTRARRLRARLPRRHRRDRLPRGSRARSRRTVKPARSCARIASTRWRATARSCAASIRA